MSHTGSRHGTERCGQRVVTAAGQPCVRGIGARERRVMTDSVRRRGLRAASVLLGGVLVLSACSDGGGAKSDGGGGGQSKQPQAEVDEAAAEKASEARISILPKDGSGNASINNAAKVSVTDGTLTKVTMTTGEGTASAVRYRPTRRAGSPPRSWSGPPPTRLPPPPRTRTAARPTRTPRSPRSRSPTASSATSPRRTARRSAWGCPSR